MLGSILRTAPRRLAAVVAAALALTAAPLAAPAAADGPGVGTPWVVTVGDSYISGEAGRWAGNTNDGEQYHDALGPTAYFDNAGRTAETIYRCHRSWAAEAFVGGGVNGKNLSCSGAKTGTHTTGDGYFKPGLDFYLDSYGQQGQARALEAFARSNNVKLVVVSIGGNNFNFGSIVSRCVENFLASPSWWPDYCKDDSDIVANLSSTNVANQTTAIKNGLLNVRQAMTNAGYTSSQYTIVVQNYMSPIPRGSGFRYSQSGYTRQSTGGCGFWNADADWANDTVLPTINNAIANAVTGSGIANIRTMNVSTAFNGRRLCENTVGLLEEKGLWDWRSAGAVDKTEWINQIRTVTTCCGNYYLQESLHPNYWGQLALRSCVRQAYNGGVPRGGTCRISATGLNSRGEPNMTLS